ncbi:unnamed protein product, partial [Rotaria sp. Silwood2]
MLLVRVKSQYCRGISQYDRCSPNSGCACFYIAGAIDIGICSDQFVDCSELVPCEHSSNLCREPGHTCVHHPQCHNLPVCYPVPSFNQQLCPPIQMINTTTTTTIPTTIATTTKATTQQLATTTVSDDDDGICARATWNPIGITVAGGGRQGTALDQFNSPGALFVDTDRSVYVVDSRNNRVMKWDFGAKSGTVVAGGIEAGSDNNQLRRPNGLVIDKKSDSLFLCDLGNLRVVQWSLGAKSGQPIISNVSCIGITMDNEGSSYLSENDEYRVSKWQRDATSSEIVAGGHGKGSTLNQLFMPSDTFVDRIHSVFVADYWNNRVMQWPAGAKQGIIVAGGNGQGNRTDQLRNPSAVKVDRLGTMYIVDALNHRVLRWHQGATAGNVIVGTHKSGTAANQLWNPSDLAFDQQGN